MKINVLKSENNNPAIAIVGCLHGDEIIGKKVIEELKKIKLLRGSLKLIIANERAMRNGKRLVKKDLNRSFPGKKNGNYEETLAYSLKKEIKDSDIVIDIHATTSDFDRIIIITNLKKPVKNILRLIPCKKVALIKKKSFGGGEMIRFAKLGMAIEYGPNKKGSNYKKALHEILVILTNLNMVKGSKKSYSEKELYIVDEPYKVPANFKINKNIKNFKLIKKNETLGESNGKKIKSTKNFHPLFIGEESYDKILAITARKNSLNLF